MEILLGNPREILLKNAAIDNVDCGLRRET